MSSSTKVRGKRNRVCIGEEEVGGGEEEAGGGGFNTNQLVPLPDGRGHVKKHTHPAPPRPARPTRLAAPPHRAQYFKVIFLSAND